MIHSLTELCSAVANSKRRKIALVSAAEAELLQLVDEAIHANLADFILIGDPDAIKAIAVEHGLNLPCEIVSVLNPVEMAKQGVKMVNSGKAEALMKGMLHTGVFLKALLDKNEGLPHSDQVSQVSVYDNLEGNGLQLLTDCAIIPAPTLEQKLGIIKNAVKLSEKLGCSNPRVALLSALETVNPNMPDTVEAAVITMMNRRGQLKGCVVDGPLALDNAVSARAAQLKGIDSPVAGHADILVAPSLLVGNTLTKAITFFGEKEVAAAVMGVNAPVIMTSRSDTKRDKLLSIALAAYIC